MQIPIGTVKGGTFSYDSDYHCAISGASGVGKSTLLKNIFVDFIRRGGGGLLVDLHGDLADDVSRLIPKSRRRDFVWIDPSADRVPPLNPLAFDDPQELQLAKEGLSMILKGFSGDAWGNETPWVIGNAINAVCARFKKPMPPYVFRFLVDDDYRDGILDASDDWQLKLFQKQYAKLQARETMAKFSPAVNKEGKLMHPAILPIIGQPDSLDMLEMMNTGKIVVCRFAEGRIGEDAAQMLASFMASTVSIASLRRESQEVRRPFMAMFDEAGSAGHSGRFRHILNESRKYGISLVLGFQGLHQLSFAQAVKTNCSTKIAFNNSGEEAEATAKDWLYQDMDNYLAAHNITALPRYHFYCRTFEKVKRKKEDLEVPDVALVKALRSAKPRYETIHHAKQYTRSLECDRDTLIKESLDRYSRDKAEVMENLRRSMTAHPAHA